jgi:hypothetical protein
LSDQLYRLLYADNAHQPSHNKSGFILRAMA